MKTLGRHRIDIQCSRGSSGDLQVNDVMTHNGITTEEKVVPTISAATGGNGGHDPDGEETGSEVRYKTMGWLQTAFVMIAETVSLGILSLPSTLKELGLIPGLILLIGLGIAATYTGYVLGQFKLRYPQARSFAEAGAIVFGPIGYYVFAVAQQLFLIFVMGAHILSFSIMMNVLTDHRACTVAFSAIGLALSVVCALPRTLKGMTALSYLSSASIVAAVFICMFGVSLRDGASETAIVLFNRAATVRSGFSAVTNIVFAYAGHVAFLTLFSEMKRPEEFYKSLYTLQAFDTALYITTAVVIYRFTGENVKSPALGSTTPRLSKIAYGVAIPTIIMAGVINGHVAIKYFYFIVTRHNRGLMHSNSWKTNSIWVAIVFTLWFVAWVIASVIPVFNRLLGLISALFLSWFSYGVSGYFWLFMNWGKLLSSPRKILLTVINGLMILLALIIMLMGLYSSSAVVPGEKAVKPFSCADNSI